MRHRKIKGRLSRRSSWRKATLKSLANDLLKYQRIETTLAKAKALRSFAEPLITVAKRNPDSVAARRQVFSKLCDRGVVKSLFDEIAPLYKDVPGGYTRIMSRGSRKGDGARMAVMELTLKTVSEDKLLKLDKQKPEKKKKPSRKDKADKPDRKGHSAPEVDAAEKEEHAIEDVKKAKAKDEQKKIEKKGFFKRFQRKSMG